MKNLSAALCCFAAVSLFSCPGQPPVNACMQMCTQVPATECVDATVLRTWSAPTSCENGVCNYVSSDRRCSIGCRDGACLADGQGGGSSGGGSSGGGSAGGGSSGGGSSGGGSAGGGSSGGGSSGGGSAGGGSSGGGSGVDGGNACDGVTCAQPPQSVCADSTNLRVFNASGTCSNGSCNYQSHLEVCANGCSNNQCVGNPCQGVTCNQPPTASCVDATTLRSYGTAGTCANGSCSYSPSDSTCQFGCANGQCAGNPCQGVTCSQPPAASCVNSTTLRTFASSGTCAGGSCTYAPSQTTCPFGCANGACTNDPCQGVSCNQPPAAACLNSTTLRTFGSSGTCSGGSCTYTPSDSTCQFGCANGACSADPCQGVTCASPPARTCVGSSVRTYAPSGTCSSGNCSYGSVDTPCANGCTNGTCNTASCGGTTCNSPPAATCTGANTLSRSFPVGTCGGTNCVYATASVTCSNGCLNGTCIAGSWSTEASGNNTAMVSAVLDANLNPVMTGCPSSGPVLLRRRTDTGWKQETVDSSNLGFNCASQVALDSADEPMVAYFDTVNGDLRFALRNGGTWAPKELIANAGWVGASFSMALDAQGQPSVLYTYQASSGSAVTEVHFARRVNGTWQDSVVPGVVGSQVILKYSPAGTAWFLVFSSTSNTKLGKKTPTGWDIRDIAAEDGLGINGISPLNSSRAAQLYFEGEVPHALLQLHDSSPRSRYWWVNRDLSQPGRPVDVVVRGSGFDAIRDLPPYGLVASNSPGYGFSVAVNRNYNGGYSTTGVALSSDALVYSGRGNQDTVVDVYGNIVKSPGACVPQCSGRTCGDDGCGGSCGTCSTGTCSPRGTCTAWQSADLPGHSAEYLWLTSTADGGVSALERDSNYEWYRTLTPAGWSMTTFVADAGTAVLAVQKHLFTKNGSATWLRAPLFGTLKPLTMMTASGTTFTSSPVSNNLADTLVRFVDNTGKEHLIECPSAAGTVIYRVDTGSGFSAPQTIMTVTSRTTCRSLAVDSHGFVVVALSKEGNPQTSTIDYLATNASGSWVVTNITSQVMLPGETVPPVNPAIWVDGADTLLFFDQYGGQFATRPASASTFTRETLPAGGTSYPVVTVDRLGNFYIVVDRTNLGSRDFVLARRTGPSTFSEELIPASGSALNVSDVIFTPANKPIAVVTDTGNVRVFSKP